MMKEEELLYALALHRVKGIGDTIAKKLIEICGSPKRVFEERTTILGSIRGIGRVLLNNLSDVNYLREAEKELKRIQDNNIVPLYFLNSNYPKHLKTCIDSPFLFFQDGNFNFDKNHVISVVGTRNMTSYGRAFCSELICGLKDYDPIIVSGFAYGVDICAHRAAIKNNLQTIGVFAHGFGQVYPKVHKKYMSDVYNNGGFLSEFWYEDAPLKENFLKRNRIVAGVSEATIIIESASRGGALATATMANSYSRDVFALPGRSSDIYSKGCNNLIKNNKAALITSAEDVIEMLGWKNQQRTKVIQPKLFVDLTEKEKEILACLKIKDRELLDVIALDCSILVHKTASLLFTLEMKGLVRPLPGNLFELV